MLLTCPIFGAITISWTMLCPIMQTELVWLKWTCWMSPIWHYREEMAIRHFTIWGRNLLPFIGKIVVIGACQVFPTHGMNFCTQSSSRTISIHRRISQESFKMKPGLEFEINLSRLNEKGLLDWRIYSPEQKTQFWL